MQQITREKVKRMWVTLPFLYTVYEGNSNSICISWENVHRRYIPEHNSKVLETFIQEDRSSWDEAVYLYARMLADRLGKAYASIYPGHRTVITLTGKVTWEEER